MTGKWICIKCGRELGGIKKFCPYCGAKQEGSWSDSRDEWSRSREDSSYEDSWRPTGGYESSGESSFHESGQTVYGRNQDPYNRSDYNPGPAYDPGKSPGYGPSGYRVETREPDGDGDGKGEKILFGILIGLLSLAIIAVSAVFVIRFLRNPDTSPRAGAGEGTFIEEVESDTEEGEDDGYETVDASDSGEEAPDKPDGTQPSYLTKKFTGNHEIKLYKNADGQETVHYDNNDENDHLPECVFVAALETGSDRTKVYYAGLTGWVKNSEIEYFSDDVYYLYDGHLSEEIYQAFKSNSGGIAPHSEPSASEESIFPDKDRIPYGREFKVKEIKEGFARIKYKGKKCWVDMHYFRTYAHDTPRWEAHTQSSDVVVLRRKKKFKNKYRILDIPNYTDLTVTTIEKGWGRVEYDGKSGWVDLKSCVPYEP